MDARWAVYQHEFPLPNPAGEHQGCRTLHMQRRQRSWTGKLNTKINSIIIFTFFMLPMYGTGSRSKPKIRYR